MSGLPGTGKSTLAASLSEHAACCVLRSDVVRKELAGLSPRASAAAAYQEGIYTPEWTERTYAECLRRAEGLLLEGQRVVVDANFGEERRRAAFLTAAARLGVSAVLLLCQAPSETARERLEARRDHVSDADWSIYRRAAEHWEEAGPSTSAVLRPIPTSGSPRQVLDLALGVLAEFGLWG